jgi:hypothetical protein
MQQSLVGARDDAKKAMKNGAVVRVALLPQVDPYDPMAIRLRVQAWILALKSAGVKPRFRVPAISERSI